MSGSGERFKDVDLGDKRLPACYGYLTSKLVTLGEAMAHLRHTMPEIDEFVKLSKKHCTYPNENNLTKEEAGAIYIYTMEMSDDTSVYRILNETLRAEDRSLVRPRFSYLKLFHTAASKLPKFKGVIWRGINKDLSQSFKKGQKITWWSISSCSESVDVIKGFLGKAPRSTLFNIECVNGKSIAAYTCYPGEEEIILMPGTTFVVVGNPLSHSGGLNIVHLKEIPDDDDEDEPQGSVAAASASATPVKSVTKKLEKISLEGEGFDPSGKVDKYCKGRLCATCGQCRDWYYTDPKTWQWIRNVKNWKDDEWQRYRDGNYYKNFQRRDGYTCTHGFSSDHHFHDFFSDHHFHHHFHDDFDGGCLCDDNCVSSKK